MKQVVIINGSAGVGKDTFVDICKEFVETDNYSSVDKVKDIAMMCGWDGKKDEKSRKFLSDLKVLLTEYNDLPFKEMSKRVELFNITNKYEFLFLHIREPKEIERAKKAFNAITLLITNNRVEQVTTNMADANVYNYKYDYNCKNDGSLNDLRTYINYFINKIKDEK